MVCAVNKIDSNITGLRIAEEECLRELPGVGGVDAKWFLQEPNSYDSLGSELTTLARNPINPSRQRKKGSISDLDASGGFNQDFTQTNMTRLLQGFFFSDVREKKTNKPINGTQLNVSSVSSAGLATFSGALAYAVKTLVLNSKFGAAANNGLKVVSAVTGTTVTFAPFETEASPPVDAQIKAVGYEFAAADVAITTPLGGYPRLTSTLANLNTLGLIPGEWVFLGGDLTVSRFTNNIGFARINAVTADYIEFDKTDWVPQAEAGTGKTIRMFYGDVVRNEFDPALIKRRSYQIERTLGNDVEGPQAEYLVGAVANELTVNIPSADKMNADLSYVAMDSEFRTGLEGLKPGTRLADDQTDIFNTSSDFSRIKLAIVEPGTSEPSSLFAYAMEMTLTINNNVTPTKAIGVLGGFDTTAGTFEVGGSVDAYFANVEAVRAVRNNADVTLDIIAVKKNGGVLFDIPLLALGDGRLNVEQDSPITLTLENMAAESKFGYTCLFESFDYLPNLAMS